MKNLSIFIVDDHQLFREGLSLLLRNLPQIGEIREASNGEVFLEILKAMKPDVVFMDVNMPIMNGIEATRRAIELHSDLNIIALSMYSEEDYYTKMIDAGAKGFILKNSGIKQVEAAIKNVMEGKNYFSQEILSGLLKNLNRKKQSPRTIDLSEREEEVLYYICKGLSNQEIAELLFISKRTVDKHRENLLFKTQSKNSAGLVIFAIKKGIVEI